MIIRPKTHILFEKDVERVLEIEIIHFEIT